MCLTSRKRPGPSQTSFLAERERLWLAPPPASARRILMPAYYSPARWLQRTTFFISPSIIIDPTTTGVLVELMAERERLLCITSSRARSSTPARSSLSNSRSLLFANSRARSICLTSRKRPGPSQTSFLAERERFELSRGITPPYRFSKPAPSASWVPLLVRSGLQLT
jgi:hypothetical protein